jgi:beta-glucosidase
MPKAVRCTFATHRPSSRPLERVPFAALALSLALGCERVPAQGGALVASSPEPAASIELASGSPTQTQAPACVAPGAPSTDFYGGPDFPSKSCRTRAGELLAKMTPREKAAQMVQLGHDQIARPDDVAGLALGSVLSGGGMGPKVNDPASWATMVGDYHRASTKSRLGIPILYGADAVHGHNNVRGAVIFPHNVGLGAARDPDLVERIAKATAEEVAATGIDWTFAPVVAPVRDERWGRTYESFGEAPELAELLGPAAVRGFQGPGLGKGPTSVLACAKHFIGDGATRGGIDRGDDDLDEEQVRKLLLPAYARAVEAKVGSIMVSYSSIRGVKMHCSGRLLTDVLKRELGFNGFVVSDWQAIDQIPSSSDANLAMAINGGIDMVMHPKMGSGVIDAIQSLVPARVPSERIDDAVRRILAVKCELGLLDPGHFDSTRAAGTGQVERRLRDIGSEAHRRLAREAVQKSFVLLKNERSVLPLAKTAKSLLVVGRSADNLGYQCGGWTIEWQGSSGAITHGTTLLEAIKGAVSPKTRILTEPDPRVSPSAALVVIGEPPYAETAGDRSDLALEPADVEAVQRAKTTGAPVIVVVIAGRPLILGSVVDLADALAVAWLPGTEGAGVADILFGDVAPTAKLPHTWPKTMSQIPINAGDPTPEPPLYPYGFGLTYDKRRPH